MAMKPRWPNDPHSRLCRAVIDASEAVSRLVFASMMPGLPLEEVRRIKREERAAREERRKLCRLLRADVIQMMEKRRTLFD
jgi:hypothetical protein